MASTSTSILSSRSADNPRASVAEEEAASVKKWSLLSRPRRKAPAAVEATEKEYVGYTPVDLAAVKDKGYDTIEKMKTAQHITELETARDKAAAALDAANAQLVEVKAAARAVEEAKNVAIAAGVTNKAAKAVAAKLARANGAAKGAGIRVAEIEREERKRGILQFEKGDMLEAKLKQLKKRARAAEEEKARALAEAKEWQKSSQPLTAAIEAAEARLTEAREARLTEAEAEARVPKAQAELDAAEARLTEARETAEKAAEKAADEEAVVSSSSAVPDMAQGGGASSPSGARGGGIKSRKQKKFKKSRKQKKFKKSRKSRKQRKSKKRKSVKRKSNNRKHKRRYTKRH